MVGKFDQDKAASVVDLRTKLELGDDKAPEMGESWKYVRLPVSGPTISEQDIDIIRREQLRNSQTIVISPNQARGPLLVLAGEARKERRALTKDELSSLKDLSKEKKTQSWLAAYLERHETTTLA